ncbi:MAG: type I methionyl aminopeptidase [Spirochaetota bacterium]
MGIYLYNSEEIKKIRDACVITANILDEIGRLIENGIALSEIDSQTRQLCCRYNAKAAFLGYKGYPAAICTAINNEVIHGIPDKRRKLCNGDIVGLDFGVLYNGFYGDSAKTFAVGNISAEASRLLRVTEESLLMGIDAAVEGNRISDISYTVETHVRKAGFEPVRDFVGHGVGRSLHEEPPIPNFGEPGRGPRIRNGMVFAIEPMINAGGSAVKICEDGWTAVTEDGSLSAHFEHTVAIVDGKAEILTAASLL